ncbi:MAG: ABC transporter permease [Clostridia bacterium]|nr:ABC transporter permease [Clostridia bacterium]
MKKHEYSDEHAKFLKKRRMNIALVWGLRIGVLALLLGFWELSTACGWVDPFLTSSPSRICTTIGSLYRDGSLFYHIGVTLAETLIGFFIAVGLGVVIALALWWSDTLCKVLEPYIVVLNALPKIALGPLIIIWFGTGSKAIIFMTVLVGIIVSTMHMLSAFLSTNKNKILLLRSMGATKLQILQKLVIPSSRSSFISMLKVNVGMAWIGSIMGEYIVSRAGLGYLIVYGGQVFKLDLVMSATFILCVLAAGMYFLVVLLEKMLIKNAQS